MTTPRRPRPGRAALTPLDVEGRVQEITRAMVAGTWSRQAAEGYAVAWGVDAATVRGHAAEAARMLRAGSALNLDEMVVTILGRLDRVYEAAMVAEDFKAAVAAVKTLAEVTGVSAPLKVALTDPEGKAAAPALPPDVARLVESEAGVTFYAVHKHRPAPALAVQLAAGERSPFDPCGRQGCAFCARPGAALRPS